LVTGRVELEGIAKATKLPCAITTELEIVWRLAYTKLTATADGAACVIAKV
jgi:hypothetical protein